MKYEYIPAGTYIFREDEPSNDKYYVVLRGVIELSKKKHRSLLFSTRVNQMLRPNSSFRLKKRNEDASSSPEKEMKVAEITKGQGFGEKALMNKTSTRTTSAITKTNCELIIIMKEDYLNIVHRFDVKRSAKLQFMNDYVPELSNISSMTIVHDLFYYVQEKDYFKHNLIMKEGEVGEYIYFIGSGECTIEKLLSVRRKKDTETYESITVDKVISVAGVGICLGEEILSDEKHYSYTVRVILFIISIKFENRFNQVIQKFTPFRNPVFFKDSQLKLLIVL